MDKRDQFREAYDWLRFNKIVMSQKDLAKLLAVSEATISKAMKGEESALTDNLISKIQAAVRLYRDNSVSVSEVKGIPLIPSLARAGSLADYSEGVLTNQCETICSPIRHATCAIQITGDSMSPRYPSGSIAFLEKIDSRIFIEWGRVFVLDTDNGAVIKRVVRSDKGGVVRCESFNEAYEPFDVSMNDIRGWYKVLGVLIYE